MITGKFGRYEIKSEVARGGMATVYHAYDPSFERDVAIKVLPQAFLHDPQFRVRFEREAKVIARIEHPAIVPVYDFGEEQAQPFIVMRFMSGGSLTDRLEHGSIPLAETAKTINRLAPALDAAHQRNVIHRDLKPGNVLFDQYGNAFLSDFGIAHLTGETGPTLTGSTILGTPSYMSPEQIQGEKNLDGRSDIYSLGVLIFQMLTGQVPYEADTPAKVMMMHVLQPVPSILDFKADLPPYCDMLIRKAMAKDPAARFATAGELAMALDSIARGEPLASLFANTETVIARGGPVIGAPMEAADMAPSARTVLSRPRGRTPEAKAQPARSSWAVVTIPLIAILFVAIFAVVGLVYLGRQGTGPLAMLAPATATYAPQPNETDTPLPLPATNTPAAPTAVESPQGQASDTPIAPSPTPAAVESPTPAPTAAPVAKVIGGADKIAFLNGNDIWVANLDGTGLTQLTNDGTTKSSLQWSPDGQAINYITGKCVQTVRLSDGRVDILTCFNYVQYLKGFEISPDTKKLAISLDNQLYIVPYDPTKLAQAMTRSQLAALADCQDFAPYTKIFIKFSHWSKDSNSVASVVMAVSGDAVQIMAIDKCTANPNIIDNFPRPRFAPQEYVNSPMIPTFGWDGLVLFGMTTYIRNNGFGDLYVYNMDLHKAQSKINPVNNTCCYRDPNFSPDGTQIIFAYQSFSGGPTGDIQLYMVPYGTLGTGLTYAPLPLPPISGQTVSPLPILRPAQ
jgi:hypothetical protein